MAAALEAGVTRLFRVGGAHAIAALAYGTATRSARRQDRRPRQPLRRGGQGATSPRDCAIDFYAGPTEIVIVAGSGPADWIAADLVAQAEHDPDARADLHHLEPRARRRASPTAVAQRRRRPDDRRGVARRARRRSSSRATPDEAMALANRIAPEHLVVDREALARRSR